MLPTGFLLVSADDALYACIREAVQSYGVLRRTEILHSERSALQRYIGIILDLDSLHAPAVETLHRLRAAQPLVPLLILTSAASVELVNALPQCRAELAFKPVSEANIEGFVQRALTASYMPDERVAARLVALAANKLLTPREVQLANAALGDESRAQLVRRLGISENTLKTQIRALLRKCEEPSLDSLGRSLVWESLLLDMPTSLSAKGARS